MTRTLRKTATALATAAALTGTANAADEQMLRFDVQGGYAFGDTHDIMDAEQSVIARAGHLTGAWRFEFEDANGPTGNAHLDAATLFRLASTGPSLSGTMRFHMHEIAGSEAGSAWLYLSYEGTQFDFDGSKATLVVDGEFVGGTGRYEGATGSLRVTSINGYDTGSGTFVLKH